MATRPLMLTKDHETVVIGGKTTQVSVKGSAYEYTAIIGWKVPRQVAWSIIKNPKVRMKLKDTSGAELPANVKLMFSVKKPQQQLWQEVGTVKYYADYKDLVLSEQLNAENDVATRFNLKQSGTVPEEGLLVLLAQSPTDVTVDWSKSEIYVGNVASNDLIETDL